MASGEIRTRGAKELADALDSLASLSVRHQTDALEAGADPILEAAKGSSEFADRSGRLRRSMTKYLNREKGKNQVVVSMGRGGPFWAPMIEFGAAAHAIKPRNRQVLKIGSGFARQVDHPGIAPRPVMRQAAERGRGAMVKRYMETISDRVWLHMAKRGLT